MQIKWDRHFICPEASGLCELLKGCKGIDAVKRWNCHKQAMGGLFIKRRDLGEWIVFVVVVLELYQGNTIAISLISFPSLWSNNVTMIPFWPWLQVLLLSFISLTESWYCNCSINYYPCERRGDWLLKALYEPRDIYHDQEASEVQTRSLFISWSFSLWDLDVHCFCLHWGQCSFIPGQQI